MCCRYIILFIGLLFGFTISAQQVTGRVVDAVTGAPVSYVNIGVLHKGIGTVADGDGKYTLFLDGAQPTDTVKLSCIGYTEKLYTISNFKQQAAKITLQPKATGIKTVVVKPIYTQKVTAGVKSLTKSVTGGFISNDLGSELGTTFAYKKKKPGVLKNVSFSIANSGYDTLVFRLNVYSMRDGLPGENILTQPVFIKTAIKNGVVTADLSQYDIAVNGPVFVSIEWVRDLFGSQLFFSFKLFKKVSFARKTSQADWVSVPGGVAIWGIIETEK